MVALAYPLATQAPVTRRFGTTLPPLDPRPHTGIDLGARAQAPVLAAAGGVARTWWNLGGGRMVGIDHGGGVETRYAHLARALVTNGQQVAAGQQIGLVGSTGALVTGAHLHYEVLVGGRVVDPAPYLGAGGMTVLANNSSSLGKEPIGYDEGYNAASPGPRANDALGPYFPHVHCEPGWIARPAGQVQAPRCFPATQPPGLGPSLEAVPGDVAELLAGPLLGVLLNVAVIGGGVLLVYRGVITLVRP